MRVNFRTPASWAGWTAERTRRSLGTLDQVMSTIANVEKSNNTLNNPGNVIYVGQRNASPSPHCFTDTITGKQDCIAQFTTLDAGLAYEQYLIQKAAAQGLTIAQFTARYAPSGSGNNPAAYAQYIADSTGLSVDSPLSAAISAGVNYGITTGPNPPATTPPDSTPPDSTPGFFASSDPAVCDPGIGPCGDPGDQGGVFGGWGIAVAVVGAVAVLALVSGEA